MFWTNKNILNYSSQHHLYYLDLLHLLENTFDRKRIYTKPSSYSNSNPNPEAQ